MPRLAAKHGVRFTADHFDPRVRRILDVALHTAPPLYDDAVWVTSANDSKHSEGSLHFDDRAFDFRCWNVEGGGGPGMPWRTRTLARQRAQAWARSMQSELGPDYDVVYEEKQITLKDGLSVLVPHIHGEYDPVLERRA